ncbi:AraC family transcriptional regulator [Nostoc sp. UHCC 0926]|uniref:helix-turn-helix domain-containing protein n=1 Tax=unclassified Nostoc TaxID=2593658 RepID=UPI00236088BE|nr:AraC family transcriptional regulator [Nostoc sp. UHCC 0926]WDD31459.1 AraC family transcriptional regulator [Nostoc sp. UHCC 0926]
MELAALRLEQVAQTSQQITQPRLLRSADIEKICHARDILLRHMHKPPSLRTLARQVGLNDYTLKRGFRQVFGITAYDCLHHYRME